MKFALCGVALAMPSARSPCPASTLSAGCEQRGGAVPFFGNRASWVCSRRPRALIGSLRAWVRVEPAWIESSFRFKMLPSTTAGLGWRIDRWLKNKSRQRLASTSPYFPYHLSLNRTTTYDDETQYMVRICDVGA